MLLSVCFSPFTLHVPQHGQLYKTVVLAARRVSGFTALWKSAQEARVTRVAINRILSNSYPSVKGLNPGVISKG